MRTNLIRKHLSLLEWVQLHGEERSGYRPILPTKWIQELLLDGFPRIYSLLNFSCSKAHPVQAIIVVEHCLTDTIYTKGQQLPCGKYQQRKQPPRFNAKGYTTSEDSRTPFKLSWEGLIRPQRRPKRVLQKDESSTGISTLGIMLCLFTTPCPCRG